MRLQVVSGSNALALNDPMTFPTVIAEWQTYLAARGAVQTTIDKWPLVIGRLERHAGKDALDMTPRDILKYLSRPIAPASRRNYQAVISHFFDFAHKHGHIDTDPTALLPTAKVPRRLPRPISETNLHTLMQTAGERTRDMIVLSAYAGFRVHEVAKMRTRHVEFDTDELFVAGKGGTEVWLPLHPLIREAALRHMGDDYWFPNPQANEHGPKWEAHLTANSVSGLIHRLMRSCGVPGTPHALRHRYATQLLEAGVDVRVVQELMRHSSLQTTALYTAVSDRRRRAAIDLLG